MIIFCIQKITDFWWSFIICIEFIMTAKKQKSGKDTKTFLQNKKRRIKKGK